MKNSSDTTWDRTSYTYISCLFFFDIGRKTVFWFNVSNGEIHANTWLWIPAKRLTTVVWKKQFCCHKTHTSCLKEVLLSTNNDRIVCARARARWCSCRHVILRFRLCCSLFRYQPFLQRHHFLITWRTPRKISSAHTERRPMRLITGSSSIVTQMKWCEWRLTPTPNFLI